MDGRFASRPTLLVATTLIEIGAEAASSAVRAQISRRIAASGGWTVFGSGRGEKHRMKGGLTRYETDSIHGCRDHQLAFCNTNRPSGRVPFSDARPPGAAHVSFVGHSLLSPQSLGGQLKKCFVCCRDYQTSAYFGANLTKLRLTLVDIIRNLGAPALHLTSSIFGRNRHKPSETATRLIEVASSLVELVQV